MEKSYDYESLHISASDTGLLLVAGDLHFACSADHSMETDVRYRFVLEATGTVDEVIDLLNSVAKLIPQQMAVSDKGCGAGGGGGHIEFSWSLHPPRFNDPTRNNTFFGG